MKLQELLTVCQDNFLCTQKLQKRARNKGVKPRSYASNDKVWLNSKYIITKQNRKFEAKFFGLFRVLHPVGKQAYKLELSRKWRIHDVFSVLLLEQDTTRKRQADENITRLEFKAGNSEEYEVKTIRDSAIYIKESESNLPGLYYLVLWNGYPKAKDIWELSLAVYHLRKMISLFHKDHADKPIATSPAVDTAPPMAMSTARPIKPT